MSSTAALPVKDALSGRIGHLSAAQEESLTQFRDALIAQGVFVPERHTDPCLLRFLRARKFDLPKALEMILAQEQWRKDFGVDELYA